MTPATAAIKSQFLALAEKHPAAARKVLAENHRNAPKATAEDNILKGWFLYLISEIRHAR